MKPVILTYCLLSLISAGCVLQKTNRTSPPTSLPGLVGERVTLVGVAQSYKVGPALEGKDFVVFIDDSKAWPDDYVGRRVEVQGILEERHDLPVFIADTPEEHGRLQGIPVPSGTDLDKASQRYVIRDAKWKLQP